MSISLSDASLKTYRQLLPASLTIMKKAEKYFASITKDKKPFIIKWLRDNKHTGLIKNEIIAQVGKGKDNETIDFIDKIRSEYAPHKVLLFKDTSINNSQLDKLASWTSTQYSIDEKPTAYICKNFACNQPTNDLKTALNLLNE